MQIKTYARETIEEITCHSTRALEIGLRMA